MLWVAVGAFLLSFLWRYLLARKARGPKAGAVPIAQRISGNRKLLVPFLAGLAAFVVVFPMLFSAYQVNIMITALIYVVLGLGLNIVVGLAGLLDLGYVAFYAVGAYSYALLNYHFGLGFWLAIPIGMAMGARYEMQLQENKGNAVNGGSLKEEANSTLDVRYSDIWVSGSFGKLSLGKGDGASNGTTEMDMSGTYMAAPANMMDMLGGLQYEAGKKVGSVYTMFDGYSRNNRLRYDSPKVSGFSVAVSSAQGNSTELALRYSGSVGGTKIQAALFTDDAGDHPSRKDTQGGSIAFKLASGFNFLVAYSTRDGGTADDPTVLWSKLGYRTGKHAMSIDYGQSSDVTTGVDGDTQAVSYTYYPAKGIETYATYRLFNVDTANSVDPTVFFIGSRVKF